MKRIFIACLVITICSSCFTERIELDLNKDNKKVVITGWITDLEEPQFIEIFESSSYFDNSPINYITNANVEISDGVQTYTLEQREAGHYFLPQEWKAIVGNEYKLEVLHDNKEFTAKYTMSSCPQIEAADYVEYGDSAEADSIISYETTFAFQEILGEGNAYYAIDYLKESLAGDSLTNGQFTDDEFFDGEYFEDIRVSEDDRLFKKGDIAIIELYSIGQEAANYLFDIESEIFRGGPFDPPPANVRSNITGGAIGFFLVSGARQVELIIE